MPRWKYVYRCMFLCNEKRPCVKRLWWNIFWDLLRAALVISFVCIANLFLSTILHTFFISSRSQDTWVLWVCDEHYIYVSKVPYNILLTQCECRFISLNSIRFIRVCCILCKFLTVVGVLNVCQRIFLRHQLDQYIVHKQYSHLSISFRCICAFCLLVYTYMFQLV